jgi:hypothetical protein
MSARDYSPEVRRCERCCPGHRYRLVSGFMLHAIEPAIQGKVRRYSGAAQPEERRTGLQPGAGHSTQLRIRRCSMKLCNNRAARRLGQECTGLA